MKPNEQIVNKEPFTPEEFKTRAEQILKDYLETKNQYFGHMAVDNFMWDVLYAAGYEERLEILDKIPMSY